MRGGVPLDIQVHPAGGAGGGTCNGNGSDGGAAVLWVLVVCCCILLLFSVGVGSSSPQTRERIMLQCQSLLEKTRGHARRAQQRVAGHVRRARRGARKAAGAGAQAKTQTEEQAETQAAPSVALAESKTATATAYQPHHGGQAYASTTGGTIQESASAYQEIEQDVKALDGDIRKVESNIHGKTYSMKDLRAKITQAGTMVDRMPAMASDGSVKHLGPIDFIRPVGLNWEQLRQKYRKEREQYTNCPYPELNGSHFLG